MSTGVDNMNETERNGTERASGARRSIARLTAYAVTPAMPGVTKRGKTGDFNCIHWSNCICSSSGTYALTLATQSGLLVYFILSSTYCMSALGSVVRVRTAILDASASIVATRVATTLKKADVRKSVPAGIRGGQIASKV